MASKSAQIAHLPPTYLNLASKLLQNCFKIDSNLLQTRLRLASNMPQTCFNIASDLPQTCLKRSLSKRAQRSGARPQNRKLVSNSETCLKHASNVPQASEHSEAERGRETANLFQTCFKLVSKFQLPLPQADSSGLVLSVLFLLR